MQPPVFTRMFASAAALAFILSVANSPASAQHPLAQRPIRVAIVSEFPFEDARVLVIRYASLQNGDLIVLKETDQTPETLFAAVALLRHLRKSTPSTDQDVVVRMKGFAPLGQGNASLTSRLSGVLAQLRAQPVARIGNLGPGRWIDLPQVVLSS